MPRFAMALNLKDDARVIAEYEKHHRSVWPEVLAAIRSTGVEEIKIYRSGRHLFMTMAGLRASIRPAPLPSTSITRQCSAGRR